jgi:hypothetical protein
MLPLGPSLNGSIPTSNSTTPTSRSLIWSVCMNRAELEERSQLIIIVGSGSLASWIAFDKTFLPPPFGGYIWLISLTDTVNHTFTLNRNPNATAESRNLARLLSRKPDTIVGQGTITELSMPHIGKGVALVA